MLVLSRCFMRVVIISPVIASKRIDRAPGTSRAAVEDMGRDHRRLHVAMGQELLNRSDILTLHPADFMREASVLGQGCVVSGESSYIRERARELGMSLRDLADRAGVSYSYMSMVARGHRNMGVKVQARMESALEAPAKVAPFHPQTNGKLERYHQSIKRDVKQVPYEMPSALEAAIAAFVAYYNYRRYHKALANVTPADMLNGRREQILQRRKEVQVQTLERRRRYNKTLRELPRSSS